MYKKRGFIMIGSLLALIGAILEFKEQIGAILLVSGFIILLEIIALRGE